MYSVLNKTNVMLQSVWTLLCFADYVSLADTSKLDLSRNHRIDSTACNEADRDSHILTSVIIRLRNREDTQLSCCNERGSAKQQTIKNSQTDLDTFLHGTPLIIVALSSSRLSRVHLEIRVGANCGVIRNRERGKIISERYDMSQRKHRRGYVIDYY